MTYGSVRVTGSWWKVPPVVANPPLLLSSVAYACPSLAFCSCGGLDRQTFGTEGRRRRVVAAPQFHENHVLTETFAFNLLMGRRWPPQPEDIEAAEACAASSGSVTCLPVCRLACCNGR